MTAAARQSRTIALPNDVLIPQVRQLLGEGHTATLLVRGRSMRLFLEDLRDKIVLAPCPRMPRRGDVILAQAWVGSNPDGPRLYVIHRVVSVSPDGLITLRGDGNIRGTEQCRQSDVIGIATGFFRKGRLKPDLVSSAKWRLYSRLWPSSPLVRRAILGVYNKLWLRLFPNCRI